MASNSPFGVRVKPEYQILQGEEMIIWTAVNFKELLQRGKEYFWPRPACCPFCGSRIWGHGFVWRYFAEAPGGCWIKRYQCCKCKRMITLRPVGYWPRFFHGSESIRSSLEHHDTQRVWPAGEKRQTSGHWLRALGQQVRKIIGLAMKIFPEGFEELIKRRRVPVSRSKRGVLIPQIC